VGDARDAFRLEHAEDLVEALVDVGAFVERRPCRVAYDSRDADASERALDRAFRPG
jgi:hypothetical protein